MSNTNTVTVSYTPACDCCGNTAHMGEDEIFCNPCKGRRKAAKLARANAFPASATTSARRVW